MFEIMRMPDHPCNLGWRQIPQGHEMWDDAFGGHSKRDGFLETKPSSSENLWWLATSKRVSREGGRKETLGSKFESYSCFQARER